MNKETLAIKISECLESENIKILFEHIKEYLSSNNITQEEFAKKINYSRGHIAQLLNGTKNCAIGFGDFLNIIQALELGLDLVPKKEQNQ